MRHVGAGGVVGLLLAGLLLFGWSAAGCRRAAPEVEPVANASSDSSKQAQQALAATLQITLVAPRRKPSGKTVVIEKNGVRHFQLVFDEGLGTVVMLGDRALILTHDHWCELGPHLLYVTLRDTDGRTLAIIEPNIFRNSIVYRDGGTLAFLAPVTIRPDVRLVAPPDLPPGTAVTIVARGAISNTMTMRQATIMTDPDEVSPRSLRLQLVGGGTLPCGNSGAGVWHEGRFIGNLWAMVDRQPGNLASGSLGTDIPTDSCIVARLPYLAALAE